MSVRMQIIKRLEEELSPLFLQVEDFSETHRGHGGYKEGGGSHISILVVSDSFEGKSRVERHRMIYQFLEDQISGGLHAIKIKALTAIEAKGRNLDL